jgi:hypothetical protein
MLKFSAPPGGFAEKDRGLLNDQLFANTFGLEDVIASGSH